MSDLEKALEAYDLGEADTHEVSELARAARKWANRTSPETIDIAARRVAIEVPDLTPRERRLVALAVLRSVEEGTQ